MVNSLAHTHTSIIDRYFVAIVQHDFASVFAVIVLERAGVKESEIEMVGERIRERESEGERDGGSKRETCCC